MELREWLIILGLALVTLIVVDGVRRLKRQRRVPRLDQAGEETSLGGTASPQTEEDANWELPNGGARVVSPARYAEVKPKPKLQRQEHPGPSRVLSEFKSHAAAGDAASERAPAAASRPSPVPDGARHAEAVTPPPSGVASSAPPTEEARPRVGNKAEKEAEAPSAASPPPRAETPAAPEPPAEPSPAEAGGESRREPTLSALDEPDPDTMAAASAGPLAADPEDHDGAHDDDAQYRLVDLEGVGDSLKSGSRRMGESMHRFGTSVQQRLAERRERKREAREEKARQAERARAEKAEKAAQQQREAAAREAAEAERRRHQAETAMRPGDDDPLFAPSRRAAERDEAPAPPLTADTADDAVVRAHPTLERALRHDVGAERARDTLSHAEEVIVISVIARDEGGFSGAALLDLMLACGLRYSSEMGIFHRFETEDPDSELQFSMVNVLKPGTFPIEAMDDFTTPGVTLLMPLPGAVDTAAAFEAMVETAMVIVRHLGGELKDENHSVMTAQTVGFARQRVQEFERRYRLSRCQAN
ncbi:cell division protein ZipA [Billgrantia azerbaijanica]|nr:cell division protein ZipA [Halomonas azerbaijanica]